MRVLLLATLLQQLDDAATNASDRDDGPPPAPRTAAAYETTDAPIRRRARPGADYVPLTPEELIPKSPEMVARATRVKEEHPERFITPADAAEMLRKGAALVDGRTEQQVLEHEVREGVPALTAKNARRIALDNWVIAGGPPPMLGGGGRKRRAGVHGRAEERAGRRIFAPVRRRRRAVAGGLKGGTRRARAGGRVRGGRR